jgi:hypothetical protein
MMRATHHSDVRTTRERMRRAVIAGLKASSDHAVSQLRDAVAPYVKSGTGQAAITSKIDIRRLRATITVDEEGRHLLFLEFGTRYMDPKPWFSITIRRITPELSRITLSAVRVALK